MSELIDQDTMVPVLWEREGLHYLSQLSDEHADRAIKTLYEKHGRDAFTKIFSINTNSEDALDEHFPELDDFLEATCHLPDCVDLKRVKHGEELFDDHMASGALALLAKSLPEGYAGARLSKILGISGDLDKYTYKRLLATLHMLINVSSTHGFTHRGHAIIIAQKLRLWHAAVRHAVPKRIPNFAEKYDGIPVNQCDMLATIMGFSLVVIQGWRILGVRMTHEEEEDFYYLWQVFAVMMGIQPEDDEHSFAHIPPTVADAEKFYAAYCMEYYVDADVNPEGVQLAKSNLKFLQEFVPWWLAIFGLRLLPRPYMQLLVGIDAMERVQLPYRLHEKALEWMLRKVHYLGVGFEVIGRITHFHGVMLLFRLLIFQQYKFGTQIMIPKEIATGWYDRAKKAKKRKRSHKR